MSGCLQKLLSVLSWYDLNRPVFPGKSLHVGIMVESALWFQGPVKLQRDPALGLKLCHHNPNMINNFLSVLIENVQVSRSDFIKS